MYIRVVKKVVLMIKTHTENIMISKGKFIKLTKRFPISEVELHLICKRVSYTEVTSVIFIIIVLNLLTLLHENLIIKTQEEGALFRQGSIDGSIA